MEAPLGKQNPQISDSTTERRTPNITRPADSPLVAEFLAAKWVLLSLDSLTLGALESPLAFHCRLGCVSPQSLPL